MSRLHRALLRLLPRERRERHGADILRVFAEQRAAAGRVERVRLWVREIAAIVGAAIRGRVPGPGVARADRRALLDSGWGADFSQAWRQLRRSPGHAATSVMCLGVGIAATVAAFSMVNTLLFGALPGIEKRETLSRVYLTGHFRPNRAGRSMSVDLARLTPGQFDALRAHGSGVAALAGQRPHTFVVRIGENALSVPGSFVSGDYFTALGTRPVTGRLLNAADESAMAPVVAISEQFRQTYFGGSEDALGAVITIGGRDVQVVGVAPARFAGYELSGLADGWVAPHLWLPLSHARGWPGLGQDDPSIAVAVRHAPRARAEAVATELATAVARMDPGAGPYRDLGMLSVNLKPLGWLPQASAGTIAGLFATFLVGPLVLLAIGCANVANLQLGRGLDRARELAVRLSLGASRGRVVRLLALEAALVAAGALGLTWTATRVVLVYLSSILPVPVVLDWRAGLVAALLALASTMLAGVAPGWLIASRLQLTALKQSRQAGARPHARLRHALVVVQLAFSLTLLVVGAQFARVLHTIGAGVPAVAPQLLVASLDFRQSGLAESARAELVRDLQDRFSRDPRVQSAAVSSDFEAAPRAGCDYVTAGDDPRTARRDTAVKEVSPAFFEALDLAPLVGRTFSASDRGTPAAVINVALADALQADRESALGRRLTLLCRQSGREERLPIEVVGVVPNGFRRWDRPSHTPHIYLPLGDRLPVAITFYIRADDPRAMASPLRRAVAARDGHGIMVDLATAADRVREESGPLRALGMTAASLGAIALLLAAAGLYAIVAHVVSQRTREIGVRMAIGATPANVVGLVVRQTLRLVVIGAGAGLALTVPIGFVLRTVFVGLSPLDPFALLPALAVLAAAASLASLVPARRAASVDPVAALRAD